eukprot:XP_001689852.1 predicted protein [Chlamydomonas reinhardtii]
MAIATAGATATQPAPHHSANQRLQRATATAAAASGLNEVGDVAKPLVATHPSSSKGSSHEASHTLGAAVAAGEQRHWQQVEGEVEGKRAGNEAQTEASGVQAAGAQRAPDVLAGAEQPEAVLSQVAALPPTGEVPGTGARVEAVKESLEKAEEQHGSVLLAPLRFAGWLVSAVLWGLGWVVAGLGKATWWTAASSVRAVLAVPRAVLAAAAALEILADGWGEEVAEAVEAVGGAALGAGGTAPMGSAMGMGGAGTVLGAAVGALVFTGPGGEGVAIAPQPQVVVANDSLNLLGAVVGGLVGSTSGLGPRAVLAGAAVGAALAMLMAVTGRRYTYVSRYGARTAGDARRAARLFGWLPGGGLRLPGAGLLPPFRF